MAEGVNKSDSKRIAVVTGANKGLGLEICKQLASKGILVILTARDENRGKEALEIFRGSGLSDFVVFHKLDVADPTRVASLAVFVKKQFGKLDILELLLRLICKCFRPRALAAECYPKGVQLPKLWPIVAAEQQINCNNSLKFNKYIPFPVFQVNNAGIGRSLADPDALKATMNNETRPEEVFSKWKEVLVENYELAVQCLETNYFGAKRMNVKNEWAKQIYTDVENLSEEKVDEVVNEFLKNYKEGSHKAKGWPDSFFAYIISKAAMNAYTRSLAKKYPTFCINCVCPGFVKTDINHNMGTLSVEEGAETPVKMALLPDGGPTGLFFNRNGVSSFD